METLYFCGKMYLILLIIVTYLDRELVSFFVSIICSCYDFYFDVFILSPEMCIVSVICGNVIVNDKSATKI
jgi:hypothetical protein